MALRSCFSSIINQLMCVPFNVGSGGCRSIQLSYGRVHSVYMGEFGPSTRAEAREENAIPTAPPNETGAHHKNP